MRRKYFMRGLGVGVIITALIFTISTFFKTETITNAEIIERAKKLGMVEAESQNLSENNKNKDETSSEDESTLEETGDKVKVENLTGDEVTPAPGEDNKDVKNIKSSQTTVKDDNSTVNKTTNTGNTNKTNKTGTTSTTNKTNTAGTTNKTNTGGVTSNTGNPSQTSSNTGSTNNSTGKIVEFSIRSGESSAAVAANLHKAGLVTNPSTFDRFLESNGYDKTLKVGTFSIREGSSEETIAKTLTGR